MDTWGLVLLVVGALVVASLIDTGGSFMVHRAISYELVFIAIAAFIGGYVASEYLGGLGEWGYRFYGLYVFPALIGAFVVGILAEGVVRMVEARGRTRA